MSKANKIILLSSLLLAILSYFFFDKCIAKSFEDISKPIYDLSELFATLISPKIILALTPLSLLLIKKREMLFFKVVSLIITISISVSLIFLLKPIFGRARPELFLSEGIYGFFPFNLKAFYHSFPSTHAATAAAFFGGLALIFTKYKYPCYFLSLLFAFTRVVNGKHFLSDVIIGQCLGFFFANLLIIRQESLWGAFKAFIIPRIKKKLKKR